jgi:hypothetical protein
MITNNIYMLTSAIEMNKLNLIRKKFMPLKSVSMSIPQGQNEKALSVTTI